MQVQALSSIRRPTTNDSSGGHANFPMALCQRRRARPSKSCSECIDTPRTMRCSPQLTSSSRVWLPAMQEHPINYGHLLCALDNFVGPMQEIVIASETARSEEGLKLAAEVWRRFLPRSVFAWCVSETDAKSKIPLCVDRPLMNGHATAYVCENFTCQQPVVDVAQLESLFTRTSG